MRKIGRFYRFGRVLSIIERPGLFTQVYRLVPIDRPVKIRLKEDEKGRDAGT